MVQKFYHKQDRQYMNNETLRQVYGNTVAVEKQ
jgi:hypothetical protein